MPYSLISQDSTGRLIEIPVAVSDTHPAGTHQVRVSQIAYGTRPATVTDSDGNPIAIDEIYPLTWDETCEQISHDVQASLGAPTPV